MTLSLQLYSMRDVADQHGLLGQLPAMGITNVEGYGGVYGATAEFRAAMDASGISMPSGHMGLADIEGDAFDASLKTIKAMGITQVFAPYLEPQERPTTGEGYADLARRLNTLAGQFAAHGIPFGWHNHDFEFVTLADGAIPMEVILDTAPDIKWEADLAWIMRGGCDPLDYINRYGNRLAAIHVKDIAPDGENVEQDGWCDLGEGTMDWAGLIAACRAQSDDLIYVLEHDKPADPIGYATRSAAAFKTLWESTNV
ncbi:MAG: sugar phosphate isomerase/epimerase [Epibacterium sp.]|nr:sugar phosphate isomerase/epimerase [Epibacterium sp.]NQX72974.1 sugar phosphate isomerase/epimerase [Epibacterium sp.]